MMLAGARLVLPAVLLPLLGASLVYAQSAPLPVDLAWNAPAECPPREAVVDEVTRLLATSHQRANATARAEVARDEQGRWHATLSVDARGAHGERVLEAEGCPAIASATALIIAIAVEGGIPQPQTAPPPVATVPTPSPAASPPTRSASQLVVAAAGVVDTAMLGGSANLGGEATLGWFYQWSRWRIRAMASASLFADQTVPPTGQRGHFAHMFAASARICASVVEGPFDLGPCLGGEFDRMDATGVGPPLTFQGAGQWESVLGSVLASWSFSRRVAVFLHAGGIIPILPPTFGMQPGDIPVLTPTAGLRGELGLELRFF